MYVLKVHVWVFKLTRHCLSLKKHEGAGEEDLIREIQEIETKNKVRSAINMAHTLFRKDSFHLSQMDNCNITVFILPTILCLLFLCRIWNKS